MCSSETRMAREKPVARLSRWRMSIAPFYDLVCTAVYEKAALTVVSRWPSEASTIQDRSAG